MVVDKIHEIISFKQCKWLEKFVNFNTQKRNRAKNEIEKNFSKSLISSFFGKTMENVRSRLRLECVKKDENEKKINEHSKLTFNKVHILYENDASYTLKQNEVLMYQPICLGFAILELSKLHMYESYYYKLKPYFGQDNIQLHYVDTDAFVLSVNTEDIIKDLKNLKHVFDFSNLDENHELFSKKNKKLIKKFKLETPKNMWIDEFVCLRSKMDAFKCRDDSKNDMKVISKSQFEHIELEENK